MMNIGSREIARVAALLAGIMFQTVPAVAQRSPGASPPGTPTTAPVPETPRESASVGTPLDEVRTRDGALLRGTIIELAPNEYVIIQTVAGSMRRVDWANVEYAGPIGASPTTSAATAVTPAPGPDASAPPPPPAVPPSGPTDLETGEVVVPFDAVSGQSLRVFVDRPRPPPVAGSGGARVVGPDGRITTSGSQPQPAAIAPECTAPCELRLTPGWHRMALSTTDGRPSWAPQRVAIRPGIRLTGDLVSRRRPRVGGIVTGVLTVVGGGILIGTARQTVSAGGFEATGWIRARVIGGSVLAGVGLSIAIGVGVGVKDRVTFHESAL